MEFANQTPILTEKNKLKGKSFRQLPRGCNTISSYSPEKKLSQQAQILIDDKNNFSVSLLSVGGLRIKVCVVLSPH